MKELFAPSLHCFSFKCTVNPCLQINTVGSTAGMYFLCISYVSSASFLLWRSCSHDLLKSLKSRAPSFHSCHSSSGICTCSSQFQLFICINTSILLFIAASSPRGQIAGTLGILGVNLQSFLILFRQLDPCNHRGSQHLSVVRQSLDRVGLWLLNSTYLTLPDLYHWHPLCI